MRTGRSQRPRVHSEPLRRLVRDLVFFCAIAFEIYVRHNVLVARCHIVVISNVRQYQYQFPRLVVVCLVGTQDSASWVVQREYLLLIPADGTKRMENGRLKSAIKRLEGGSAPD